MALTFTGASGVFAQIGAFGKALNNAVALSNLTANELAHLVQSIRTAAQAYLIRMVSNDTNLRQMTVQAALEEVIRQMLDSPDTLDGPTASTSASSSLTTDSLCVAVNYKERFNNTNYCHRPGTIKCICVGTPVSANHHTARWQIVPTPLGDVNSSTWFTGFPFAPIETQLASGQTDGYRNCPPNWNMLVNGGFERVASNLPDNWLSVTGSAGTNYQSHATACLGTTAMKFIGDGGGTLTAIRQQLGVSSGTTAWLKQRTHYATRVYLRRYGTGAITGVLRLALKDGSGNILNGGLATVSVDLSGLGTTYTWHGATFYIGDTLPSSAYLHVELTTALGSGHEVFIDEVVLTPMIQLPGFGRVALFDGFVASVLDDFQAFTVGNDASAAHCMLWERLFDITSYDLSLPAVVDGSETVADAIAVNLP